MKTTRRTTIGLRADCIETGHIPIRCRFRNRWGEPYVLAVEPEEVDPEKLLVRAKLIVADHAKATIELPDTRQVIVNRDQLTFWKQSFAPS